MLPTPRRFGALPLLVGAVMATLVIGGVVVSLSGSSGPGPVSRPAGATAPISTAPAAPSSAPPAPSSAQPQASATALVGPAVGSAPSADPSPTAAVLGLESLPSTSTARVRESVNWFATSVAASSFP